MAQYPSSSTSSRPRDYTFRFDKIDTPVQTRTLPGVHFYKICPAVPPATTSRNVATRPSASIDKGNFDDSRTRRAPETTSGEFRQHKILMQRRMKDFLTTTECRRKLLLSFFDERPDLQAESKCSPESCCDNCRRTAVSDDEPVAYVGEKREFGSETLKFFKAVKNLNGRYGLQVIVLYLRGSKSKKMKEQWLNDGTYGSGKANSEKWWKAFGLMLKDNGYLEDRNFDGWFGYTLALSKSAWQWLGRCIGPIPASMVLPVSRDFESADADAIAKEQARRDKSMDGSSPLSMDGDSNIDEWVLDD